MTERPLSGIRVLDSTSMTAGPWGVQILADLGAEVIKIERPGRQCDVNRRLGVSAHNTSSYFMCMNKDKKSIEFDYSKPGHKETFLKLVEKCDVVTENFKSGSMKRLGLDYETLKKVNPGIVYSAVSGFGQTGPKHELPAVDIVIQATSGFMSVNGDRGSSGMKGGTSLADVYASTCSALAMLAGILYKMETGEGVLVDTSMQSTCMTRVGYELAKYLNTGEITKPNGNAAYEVGFSDTVPVKDGQVMVDASEDDAFAAFMKLLGLEEHLEDERFKDAVSRHDHADSLKELILPAAGAYTMSELAQLCRAAGVPAGEVNTQDRLLRSSYLEDQEMIMVVRDKKFGDCKTLGLPIQFDQFEIPKLRKGAQAGEDTADVLKELLGMSEEEIKELYSYEGAVRV